MVTLDKGVVIESWVSFFQVTMRERRQCPLNVDFFPVNNILEKKSTLIFLSSACSVAIIF